MDNRNIQQNFVELKKPWKERAGETEQEDEAGQWTKIAGTQREIQLAP
ncbi:MAG: hypothetical protein WAL98_08395 [Desulfatiglandaceae bacterium]|jgi:hypothetical protein